MNELTWKAVSSYIRGRGHIENDEPCQDRAMNFKNGDILGIVLCDGAGSCKYSEQGAITVTEAFTTITTEQFDEWYHAKNTSEIIQQFVVEKLEKEVSKIDGSNLSDFSCTLLFSIIKGEQYLAGHVGDGVICIRENNELSVLSHPENGRYANETYFVTMTPLNDHFRIYKGIVDAPVDFMMMSDGAAISFYLTTEKEMETENTLMLFDHLVENSEDDVVTELYELLELVRKNTSDDCAIAILASHTEAHIALSKAEEEQEEAYDDSIDFSDDAIYEDDEDSNIEEDYNDEIYFEEDEHELYEDEEQASPIISGKLAPSNSKLPKLAGKTGNHQPSRKKVTITNPNVLKNPKLTAKFMQSKRKKERKRQRELKKIEEIKKMGKGSKKKRIQKKQIKQRAKYI